MKRGPCGSLMGIDPRLTAFQIGTITLDQASFAISVQ